MGKEKLKKKKSLIGWVELPKPLWRKKNWGKWGTCHNIEIQLWSKAKEAHRLYFKHKKVRITIEDI